MSLLEIERRSRVRYWLYRAKKKEIDGTPLGDDAPSGFQEFEEMQGFTSWRHFAEGAPFGWDISEESPYTIVTRNHSVASEWDAELARTVKPLPVELVEKVDDGSEGDI